MSLSTKKHCCDKMDYYADYDKDCEIIRYISYDRTYNFILHGSWHGAYEELLFCPWCGIKLPKSLSQEWSDIIDKECGTSNQTFDQIVYEKLPKEFKTDEWWKKRGL